MLAASLTNAAVLTPGTRLGRYELLKQLAIGGMAEIFLAKARGIEHFEKLVVLKRILPQYASCQEFVTMFLDEARLAATLQHANIAQVYDIGEDKGCLFFTMEFINGEDARSLLKRVVNKRRRLPVEHALTIVIGAAAGLHSAHEKTGFDGRPLNIVHRDVSPANVLISFDGCVKLIDFGVAKAAERQTETVAGTLKGKVAYMAPEQCRGEPLDRRADVFALGILLYELTTSRKLFRGNEYAILKQITDKPITPPSRIRSTYPPELERIVMKALAKDAVDRYPTAQHLQLDLERFARTSGMVTSSLKLGEYMRDLFAPKLDAWVRLERELREARDARTPVMPVAVEISYSDDAEDDVDEHSICDAIPEALASAPPSHSVSIATELGPNWRRRGVALACAAAGAVIAMVSMLWLGNGDLAQASSAAPPVTIGTAVADPTPTAPATRTPAAAPTTPVKRSAAKRPNHRLKAPAKRPRAVTKTKRTRRAAKKRKWDRDSALPP